MSAELERDVYLTYKDMESAKALDPALMSMDVIFFRSRNLAINMMSQEAHEQKLLPETFFLAVAIFDHYLAAIGDVEASPLTAFACLFLAAKYEEEDVKIFHMALRLGTTLSKIKEEETRVFETLKYNLGFVSIYTFLNYYTSKIGHPLLSYQFERGDDLKWALAAEPTLQEHSSYLYLAELLCTSQFRKELPSKLACVAIYLTRASRGFIPVWDDTLKELTNYEEEQFQTILMKLIILLRQEDANSNKMLITRKYSEYMFHRAAPALLEYVSGSA